jgi:hypothetical protein
MMRRPQSRLFPFGLGFVALGLIFLLVCGCTTAQVTPTQEQQSQTPKATQPGIVQSSAALASLKDAQDTFMEAVRSDGRKIKASGPSLQQYQQVVDVVQHKVLGQVGKPQEVGAYAILAFSQWRLGHCAPAMEAANKGRQIYESESLVTNPRDYAMLLMVGGLCAGSQAYNEFISLKGRLTQETARSLTERLAQALRAIDSGDRQMDRGSDIAIYTHQWELALVDAAVRIWTSGLPHEVWQPEVCNWLGRADRVLAKFPATPYPSESITLDYKKKFAELKAAECR